MYINTTQLHGAFGQATPYFLNPEDTMEADWVVVLEFPDYRPCSLIRLRCPRTP